MSDSPKLWVGVQKSKPCARIACGNLVVRHNNIGAGEASSPNKALVAADTSIASSPPATGVGLTRTPAKTCMEI